MLKRTKYDVTLETKRDVVLAIIGVALGIGLCAVILFVYGDHFDRNAKIYALVASSVGLALYIYTNRPKGRPEP